VKLRSSATVMNADRTLSSSRTIVYSRSTTLADFAAYPGTIKDDTLNCRMKWPEVVRLVSAKLFWPTEAVRTMESVRAMITKETGSRGEFTRRSLLRTVIAAVTLPLVSARSAKSGGHMEIQRSGSRPSAKGPAEWFTGTVRIDPLFDAPVPARAGGASVTFEPGARTAWHTHPLGQTLIVTAGFGRAQRWGGPVEEIRPGDVVWFPPGEKHWHGASPTTALTHIAIQEKLEGKAVDWLEHVSAEQYEGRSSAR
jgi:quercetin dioxygenase-like cupin family protein